MTGQRDPISVLEAAYAWNEDETRWLDGVVDALLPYRVDAGVVAYVADLERFPRLTSAVARNMPVDGEFLRHSIAGLPRRYALAVHAPSSSFVSVQEACTQAALRCGVDPDEILAPGGFLVPNSWGFRPGDPGRFCCSVIFISERAAVPPRESIAQLCRLAPHLASAIRLRRAALGPPRADEDATEAVIGANGVIHDARGPARERGARERLAGLARGIDRSRTRRGRAAASAALSTWTALLDGRWSLVETFEQDGRRFLLARRNAPDLRDPVALSPSERAVTALAVEGQSLKIIAYALGLSRETAHTRLSGAMRKLHVTSRAELIRVYAPVFAGLAPTG